MVKAGCQYAVVETSSEGIAQHRHAASITTSPSSPISPEHIESHGGSRTTSRKGKALAKLAKAPRKTLAANRAEDHRRQLDSPHAGYFLKFTANKKYGYAVERKGETREAPKLVEWRWPSSSARRRAGIGRLAVHRPRCAVRAQDARHDQRRERHGCGLDRPVIGARLHVMSRSACGHQSVPGRQAHRARADFTAMVDYPMQPNPSNGCMRSSPRAQAPRHPRDGSREAGRTGAVERSWRPRREIRRLGS